MSTSLQSNKCFETKVKPATAKRPVCRSMYQITNICDQQVPRSLWPDEDPPTIVLCDNIYWALKKSDSVFRDCASYISTYLNTSHAVVGCCSKPI